MSHGQLAAFVGFGLACTAFTAIWTWYADRPADGAPDGDTPDEATGPAGEGR